MVVELWDGMLMWALGAVDLTETAVSDKQEERNWSETLRKKKLITLEVNMLISIQQITKRTLTLRE